MHIHFDSAKPGKETKTTGKLVDKDVLGNITEFLKWGREIGE